MTSSRMKPTPLNSVDNFGTGFLIPNKRPENSTSSKGKKKKKMNTNFEKGSVFVGFFVVVVNHIDLLIIGLQKLRQD